MLGTSYLVYKFGMGHILSYYVVVDLIEHECSKPRHDVDGNKILWYANELFLIYILRSIHSLINNG